MKQDLSTEFDKTEVTSVFDRTKLGGVWSSNLDWGRAQKVRK